MADITRNTAGVALPPALASEIWATAEHQSVIMQAFPKINLPGQGQEIQVLRSMRICDP